MSFDSKSYEFGEFELDLRRRELRRAGEPVPLQNRVFDLLVYLIEHRDEAVAKDRLIEAVWPGTVVTDSVLTRAAMKARKALGEGSADAAFIRTVHGFGYRFVGDVTVREDPSGAPAADEAGHPGPGATEIDLDRTEASTTAPPPRSAHAPRRSRLGVWITVATGLLGIAALVAWVLTGIVDSGQQETLDGKEVRVPRLAVLPFENLSPDPEQDYFASGIQEDILNEIARSTDVRVIGRSSVARYRDGDVPVSRIAADLGVDHVLEGSIRYAEGKVRVSARLVDGGTGVQLWSHNYDRDFTHIFEIQSDIARRIAGALRVAMRPGVEPVVPADTSRARAYEEYLIARNFRDRVFVSGWGPIIEHTRQALAADPNFIPALWMLHNAYQNRIIGDSHADALKQMRSLTARAQQEDPNDPLTLSLMAKDAGFAWRWGEAASLWSAAVAADPTDPFLLGSAAFAALGAGDSVAALGFADQGIDADPDHDWPRYARMTVLRAMGEMGAARHEAELVFALHGDRAFPAAMTLALAAAMQGDVDMVRSYADFMVAAVGEPMAPFRDFLIGLTAGEPDLALLEATLERVPAPNANKWMVVQSRISAGDMDGAFAALDDVARSHAMYSVIRIVSDPAFAPLRRDPRYRSFSKTVRHEHPGTQPG